MSHSPFISSQKVKRFKYTVEDLGVHFMKFTSQYTKQLSRYLGRSLGVSEAGRGSVIADFVSAPASVELMKRVNENHRCD
jgi:hypothetical protein